MKILITVVDATDGTSVEDLQASSTVGALSMNPFHSNYNRKGWR